MNFRFSKIWLAISFFSGATQAAGNPVWDCQQGSNGEWTCLNQGNSNPEPVSPAPPAKVKLQVAEPVPVEPSKPISVPLQTVEPKQPEVVPAPVKVTEQTPAQPVKPALIEGLSEKSSAKLAQEVQHLQVKINEKPKAVKPPEALAEREASNNTSAGGTTPGWTCKTGTDSKDWNCNLVGADPQGEAKPVVNTQVVSPFLTPAFSQSQERTFQTLRAEFDHDPWQSCQTWGTKKRKIKPVDQRLRDAAETLVNADSSEIFDGDVLTFAGNVDLNRADQHLLADKASYDTSSDTMDAQGHVIYSESQLAFASETASLSLDKDEARLRAAQFIAAEGPIRGSSAIVYRDSSTLSRYHEAAFTSCAPGNQDWVAHAERLKINRESGKGSAKNAWLEFKGVPFLYTPYISFPVDNRRLSGLLAPNFSFSQRNGFDTTVPFYWNIAPNYDMIITPRYLAKRGGMLREKFRYMGEASKGSLGAEYLPNDELLNKARYSASWKDQRQYTDHLNSIVDLNYVSDKTYFNDLNNALGFQSSSFLNSTGFLNYGRQDVMFSAGIQHFQSVDKAFTDNLMPYDVLPRVNLNLNHDFAGLPLRVAMDNQFSYFHHVYSSLSNGTLPNGQRINLAPSVSLPFESEAGFFIPKITGQYTQYQLSNQTAGTSDSISRTLPIFSVDAGMAFEKALNFNNKPFTHTLEPHLYYLYIPRKDQSNIPIFDTALLDTNSYSLFRENRFSGLDRIQDANQVTLAGTTRFIDSTTGLEPLKVTLGQILYFQNRSVDLDYLNNVTGDETSKTSRFIGEFAGQITKHLSYATAAQWDPETNSVARGQAVLKFRNQPSQILDVGYRYRRADPSQSTILPQTISQTDVSFRWPLFAEWYGLGRWQYSLNFDRTTESFIGIEKENCCWRFRIIARRYINGFNSLTSVTNYNDPNLKPETAFFMQLELKGLTSFGDSVDTFLQNNLNGYRKASFFE